jgi:hypothetical protein
MLFGKVISVIWVYVNTLPSIIFRLSGNSISRKLWQDPKVSYLISFNPLGKLTFLSLVQPLKVYFGIVVIPSGKIISSKFPQELKI